MKKSVLAILALLILAACQYAPQAQTAQPTDFRFGTEGLHMEFVQNLPPAQLFDRDPFNVMISLENRGTSKVGGGLDRIYLSGFDHNIITGISTDGASIPSLDGRGPYVQKGGFDSVTFNGVTRSLTEKNIDKYQPLLLATACYSYETDASAQVCIDPNPYAATSVQKVCTPTNVGLGSEGAPIAITGVNVEAAPGTTRFTINVQNVGGGNVFKSGAQYMSKCSPYSPGLGFDEVDFVQVADVIISGVSIKPSCKPLDNEGHIRLTNGVGQIFCQLTNVQGQTPYVTPLNIVLRYGYRQSIAKPLEIRPIS